MNILEKLSVIQSQLNAPKSQFNSFGKYNYRSCEDILEAVKPLCKENKAVLMLTDEIVPHDGRFYVRAVARLVDLESPLPDEVTVSAFARESEKKSGMDDSQITGSASSYARKYALNGLFCIDDAKDADTDEQRKVNDAAKEKEKAEKAKSEPPKSEPKGEPMAYCAECGKPIYTAAEGAKYNGDILCRDCIRKAKNAGQQG